VKRLNETARGPRLPAPLLGFAAVLCLSLSLRCAAKSDPGDAGSAAGHGGTVAAGGHAGAGPSGGAGATGGVLGGAGGTGGGHGGAGGAPACTTTTVANDCPVPGSECEADGRTLDYYSDPFCLAGVCEWSVQKYRCPGLCAGGSCLASTTTTSGPPPVTCGTGASGAGGELGTDNGCPIPASICVDAQTLQYYQADCVQGVCETKGLTLYCGSGCVNGACAANLTK
jgi:hypothetical protein